MNHADLDNTIARWSRVGVLFGSRPARTTPDLERLLLDTARLAPGNARLFYLAITCLSRYGNFVARHRLKRLIETGLEVDHQPVLGALLTLAVNHGASRELLVAADVCSPADAPAPCSTCSAAGRPWRRSPIAMHVPKACDGTSGFRTNQLNSMPFDRPGGSSTGTPLTSIASSARATCVARSCWCCATTRRTAASIPRSHWLRCARPTGSPCETRWTTWNARATPSANPNPGHATSASRWPRLQHLWPSADRTPSPPTEPTQPAAVPGARTAPRPCYTLSCRWPGLEW